MTGTDCNATGTEVTLNESILLTTNYGMYYNKIPRTLATELRHSVYMPVQLSVSIYANPLVYTIVILQFRQLSCALDIPCLFRSQ